MESLKAGDVAVAAFLAYIRSLDPQALIMSVEDDLEYQKAGIDFIVIFHDGRALTFEVKGDLKTPETGNIVLEIISNENKNTPGWAKYSRANILFYAALKHVDGKIRFDFGYNLNMQKLRRWLADNEDRCRICRKTTVNDYNRQPLYQTVFALYPIDKLAEALDNSSRVEFDRDKKMFLTKRKPQ